MMIIISALASFILLIMVAIGFLVLMGCAIRGAMAFLGFRR